MRLDGRRESSNVDDRRGGNNSANTGRGGSAPKISMGKKGGCFTLILAIVGLFIGMKTGNWGFFQQVAGDGIAVEQPAATSSQSSQRQGSTNSNFTEKDVENLDEASLASFCKVILGSTEDVWGSIFKQNGRQYQKPTMVYFENEVRTACGDATSSTGPFYCSGDQNLYIDLSFYNTLKNRLGAGGDFAFAYVIAHEVGHHIEYELGILQKLHAQMNNCRTEAEQNKISVRIELLADFYAGIWGHYENKQYKSISDKDVEEAIKCAHQIGDDFLQKSSRGYVNAKEFTHGTSQQRMKWFKLGYTTGDINKGQTILTCPESEL